MQRIPTELELVTDIFSCIAHGAIREGFTAEEVFEIIDNSSAEEIFEYYMNYDPDLLIENVNVSEEFINEQTEILNEFVGALLKGMVGGAARGVARGAKNLATKGFNLGRGFVRRAFGPSTRKNAKDAVVKLKNVAGNFVKGAGRATVNTAKAFALPAAVGYGLYKGGEKVADAIKNNNNNKNDTAPSAPQGGTAADKGGIEASGETKAIEPPKSVEPKSERKKRSGFRRSAMDLSGGLTKVQRNNRSIGR